MVPCCCESNANLCLITGCQVLSTATGDGAWLLGMPSVLQDASGRIVGSNERYSGDESADTDSSSALLSVRGSHHLSGLLELCKGGQPHSCARGGTQGDTVRP